MDLCTNAGYAMREEGGVLEVKLVNVELDADFTVCHSNMKPGASINLTVSDTGCGMSPQILDRIFDPFFTTKEMGRGTGLGLASVYGITKSHDGYIEVESQKHQGTTFIVSLPASEKTAFDPPEAAFKIVEGSGTILLIDDEETVLEVAVKVLKKMGYTVLEAQSGKQGVDIFAKHKDNIDLVILDMIMPDMGGGEAFDRIKEIDPRVKVLLSSGYSIDGQAGEIMKRGCDGFIQKPFKANALSEKLKQLLVH